jgi:sugar phosphate isomerase/epimerase
MADLRRLSFNQATAQRLSLGQIVEGCARAGISWIGPWRDKVAAAGGAAASARLIRDAGLGVSSLCRGGFFPAATEAERQARLDDNRRAIDGAAELGTDVLVLVCGPAPDRDIDAARRMVEGGIEALLPYAAERGVRLAIEPLHPMFAGDRSVIVTLAEANGILERLDSPQAGVVIDVYHVWWDASVYAEIGRARGRILGFHVSDWLAPPPDVLLGRGLMGDGVIEIGRLRAAVEAAGYDGPIEVEIFNRELWERPGDELLASVKERFERFV